MHGIYNIKLFFSVYVSFLNGDVSKRVVCIVLIYKKIFLQISVYGLSHCFNFMILILTYIFTFVLSFRGYFQNFCPTQPSRRISHTFNRGWKEVKFPRFCVFFFPVWEDKRNPEIKQF
jgi:hypothetical protein